MKIKLVTFAPHPNFGTCLQSYALNKVLRDMGYEVEFIYNGHENPRKGIKDYCRLFAKWILPTFIVRKIQRNRENIVVKKNNYAPIILALPNARIRYFVSRMPFYEKVYKMMKCRTTQWKKVYKFTFEDGNFKMRRIYTHKQYNEVVNDADIFITGSDQIWNPYCGGFNPMMFLEFAESKKRIAYSSSIARPEFPIEVRDRAKSDLSKFAHIAVREEQSVNMLNELLGRKDVKHVVDPTLLVSKKEWSEFASHAVIEFQLPDKYILCYFLGDMSIYEVMVNDIRERTGIKDVITVDCTGGIINYGNGLIYRDGGPYEFVYLIEHASFVCMNSFHATIFSLIFNVNFVHALKTQNEDSTSSQNSRMYSLLKRYGLTHKLYSSKTNNWIEPIDYQNVNKLIDADIIDSINFLKFEIESD